ncbi:Gfo/Idh/MocA family oxidoreductase [Micrococcales bacterium 31B]|nr:Gfo/Idh/MocA family oxidoreductase [Micrococcales bacterium 31B]
MQRRFAIVGTGHRSGMYFDAIMGEHAEVAELVALCDANPGRMDLYQRRFEAAGGEGRLAQYAPGEVARMITEQRVDVVVITTPDATHAAVAKEALEAGADVVIEKPLTTTLEGCQLIAGAVEATGRNLAMTFNYRYSPRNSALREAIASGRIGRVTSVHFEWVLDTSHGADYFRRWHSDKSVSGGLLIHKSSHHFDLVNWWLQDVPERVYARGGLRFYGAQAAESRGVEVASRPKRGTGHGDDPFNLDLNTDPYLRELYLDNEQHDGYQRDKDVFREGISIEDNLSLIVDYASGATMTYSLNAHSPWEGYRVCVNGTEGRLELDVVERAAVLPGTGDVVDPSAREAAGTGNAVRTRGEKLVLQRHWEPAVEIEIEQGEGGHGGGDAKMLRDLFRGTGGDDPLGRPAGYRDGMRSVIVGISGNKSLATGQPVEVAALGVDVGREVAARV